MKTTMGCALALTALALGVGACGGEGGNEGGSGGSGGGSFDACAVVTQADADALFENAASKETGTPITDPNLLGECLWGWQDASANSELLQFRVWNGAEYYGTPPADSQAYAIGDKGYVRVDSIAGIDIAWVQGSRTVNLSFSKVGTPPDPATKLDGVKALAQKASGAL